MKTATKLPFQALAQAINEDPEYAWAWHCNITMPLKDELHCTHLEANNAAARIMQTLFSVDMTKHPHFPAE